MPAVSTRRKPTPVGRIARTRGTEPGGSHALNRGSRPAGAVGALRTNAARARHSAAKALKSVLTRPFLVRSGHGRASRPASRTRPLVHGRGTSRTMSTTLTVFTDTALLRWSCKHRLLDRRGAGDPSGCVGRHPACQLNSGVEILQEISPVNRLMVRCSVPDVRQLL